MPYEQDWYGKNMGSIDLQKLMVILYLNLNGLVYTVEDCAQVVEGLQIIQQTEHNNELGSEC
jgi:hypothetical protein